MRQILEESSESPKRGRERGRDSKEKGEYGEERENIFILPLFN